MEQQYNYLYFHEQYMFIRMMNLRNQMNKEEEHLLRRKQRSLQRMKV